MNTIPSISPITPPQSSHQEIEEPSWLDRVLSIFQSTIGEKDRLNEVEQLLESESTHLFSPLGNNEKERVKQVLDLAKELLNPEKPPSLLKLSSFHTFAYLTLNEYAQRSSSSEKRMNNLNDPWNLRLDRWIEVLIYERRFHFALQLFKTIPSKNPYLKSSAGQKIAIAYAREGNTENALSFLQNIPDTLYHNLVRKEIIEKYFEQGNFAQLQKFIDQEGISQNLYFDIGKGYSDAGEFDCADRIASRLIKIEDQNRLKSLIAVSRINHGLKSDLKKEHELIDEMLYSCNEGRILEAFQFLLQNKDRSEQLTEPLAKFLFENELSEDIFQFNSKDPVIRDCRQKILELYYEAGRFDDALSLLLDPPPDERTSLDREYVWKIQTLQAHHRWNLQHKDHPYIFQFTPPLPEALLEALETGHYSQAITLLRETFPDVNEAKNWFQKLFYTLRSSNNGQFLAAHFLDCIPYEWKNGNLEDTCFLLLR